MRIVLTSFSRSLSIASIHESMICSILSALSRRISPYLFKRIPRPVRSNNWQPMLASSLWIVAERAGCVIFNFCAAFVIC